MTPGRIVLWQWRARRRGDVYWRRLAWRMTEHDARTWAAREHREVAKVPGTAEVVASR